MPNPRVGPHRQCHADDCRKRIPQDKNGNAKYCSERCRNRVYARKKRQKKRDSAIHEPIIEAALEQASEDLDRQELIADFLARRGEAAVLNRNAGPAYQAMMRNPQILAQVMSNEMSYKTAGELLGYSQSTISKVMEQVASELKIAAEGAEWELGDEAGWLLGKDLGLRIGMNPEDATPELIEEMADRFVAWRDALMTDERGNQYITKRFHRDWIRDILTAIFTGKRKMILSPPRHGKTQLLIDFCVWLILIEPNVRILWIASNADLAQDWLASITDQLENNLELRRRYLPPGTEFKPATRSGKSWSRSQFTVATRSVTGIKSPTMQAVGRNGRILSRDVDFMIVDDIEDDGSTSTPGALADTRKWFTLTAGSRKEEHTAVVVIGSRQDPEDLYGHLLENVEWDCTVTEAHNSACTVNEYEEEKHITCMLFPEKRSYRWLQQQRRSMALEGGDELFEMVYLNRAVPRGLMVFDEAAMRARIDKERDIGEYPEGSLLVAGLDPAVAGYQSAFLWAYQQPTNQLHMVDLVVNTGPGIQGFLEQLRVWRDEYPTLYNWVVEQNAFQRGYLTDREVREFKLKHDLHIQGHETQQNKWDSRIGVGAMARLFTGTVQSMDETKQEIIELPAVSLPGASPEALAKVDVYIRQAKHFSTSATQPRSRSGIKSDVLMASWFPMKVIRMWKNEWEAEIETEYDQSYVGFPTTEWDEVPW